MVRAATVLVGAFLGDAAGAGHHLLQKVNGAWREAKVPDVFSCWWAS